MYPFVMLISTILSLLNLGLFIYIILRMLISFQIINGYQPFVSQVMQFLSKLYEPMLKPIRQILPDLGGIDISPIILFLLFQFLEHSVTYYLLPLG